MKRKISIAAILAAILIITIARGIGNRRDAHTAERTAAAVTPPPFTLIIDAGHGGEDGGAFTNSGLLESRLNLDIALRADALAAFFGVRTELTRNSEILLYSPENTTTRSRKAEDQRRRLAIVQETANAVFLSIHQNTYQTPSPYGAQVLYAPTQGSEELGVRLQTLLTQTLDPTNRRTAERVADTILLMNNIDCPAVLVECSFMSNPAEAALLQTDKYRTKLAVVLTAAILQSRDELATHYTI